MIYSGLSCNLCLWDCMSTQSLEILATILLVAFICPEINPIYNIFGGMFAFIMYILYIFGGKLPDTFWNRYQFTMEMAANEAGNIPKSYSLNMFKDFVPMSVFSETNQGENLNSCSLKNLTTCVSFCGLVNTNIFSIHGCCGDHMLHWKYLREDDGVAFNQIPRWLRIVKAVFVNCWPK